MIQHALAIMAPLAAYPSDQIPRVHGRTDAYTHRLEILAAHFASSSKYRFVMS